MLTALSYLATLALGFLLSELLRAPEERFPGQYTPTDSFHFGEPDDEVRAKFEQESG